MYAIRCLCHRTDVVMDRHGFSIDLSPKFKAAVADSGITQANINTMLGRCGRVWLDATGFSSMFDPDNCGAWADRKKPPGPNAKPMYEPNLDLRVQWGAWGPEHISVPGNACGLDINEHCFGSLYREGRQLVPHNIDSLSQKYLLLIVFTEIAESVILMSDSRRKPVAQQEPAK